jgi:phosphopantothenoylcysteine decarboxylase/phosphopantothenate--cysteine ligase
MYPSGTGRDAAGSEHRDPRIGPPAKIKPSTEAGDRDDVLSGKTVLLGITGSIAAYKALQIVRDLTAIGAQVRVVLTPTAHRFVPALTLQVFSGHPVFSDLFDPHDDVLHLTLARDADLILIAPATAHFMAKMAAGLSDDLLGNLLLSATAPVLVAPAMDLNMWSHPTVRQNVSCLRERGIVVIDPDVGPLASGAIGAGRLVEPAVILSHLRAALGQKTISCTELPLKDDVVLVTAGPTREPIDPVRFISNRSSGKMGYAIAEVAQQWGARVILISGPTALIAPEGVLCVPVQTAHEMRQAVERYHPEVTLFVAAAAVSDYRTRESSGKLKKTGRPRPILLEETEDILASLKARKGERFWVGFAAETEALLENAQKKLKQKGLDLIVANDVTQPGAGFDVSTNIAHLMDAHGKSTPLPMMSKTALAARILEEVLMIRGDYTAPPRRRR